MGISFRYGGGVDFQHNRSVGKVTKFNSQDDIYVNFPEYPNYGYFQCTVDEIEIVT